MSKRLIDGKDFAAMVLAGAECLQRNAEHVNALNVFPVPDGDTGTNMNLTMSSGTRELQNRPSEAAGKVAEALSKGLLMGARGNSGVILSQLFRGFAKGVAGLDTINPVQFANALQSGVDMAYKAVVRPVEGTILTVARESAKHTVAASRRTSDIVDLVRELYERANEALQRTPEQLPVLKQVGVVDSGGQGLVFIYEGFLRELSGRGTDGSTASAYHAPLVGDDRRTEPAMPAARRAGGPGAASAAQSKLSTEQIEFLYDMEFFINRRRAERKAPKFDEASFKRALARDGDCVLVIEDGDIVKVHVHSRKPGDVLNLALPYGELTDIHILNMRDQHRELTEAGDSAGAGGGSSAGGDRPAATNVEEAALGMAVPEVLTGTPADAVPVGQAHEWAPHGIIAVALGEGIGSIFLENNVDIVLSGGQTMNPSAEDFVHTIESLPAEHIYVLPNNGNIILAAEQAAELSGRHVSVVPTKTIMQGLAALLAFRDEQSAELNAEAMAEAALHVRSGQVTTAVRNTSIDGIDIHEGDYLGIMEKSIVAASPSVQQTCRELIGSMMEDGGELITVLTGEQADETETGSLVGWVRETYPEAELEVHEGGQPLYPYLIAVE